jgi:hypothetical protein
LPHVRFAIEGNFLPGAAFVGGREPRAFVEVEMRQAFAQQIILNFHDVSEVARLRIALAEARERLEKAVRERYSHDALSPFRDQIEAILDKIDRFQFPDRRRRQARLSDIGQR